MKRKANTPKSRSRLVQMGLEVRGCFGNFARLKRWAKRASARERRNAQKLDMRRNFYEILQAETEDAKLDLVAVKWAAKVALVKAIRDAEPEDYGSRMAAYSVAANGEYMVIASCG
jgi:phosphopantetheinyl transferase (holo-ACP synthase)